MWLIDFLIIDMQPISISKNVYYLHSSYIVK